MELKYFKDIDVDTVYACIGPWAAKALFRLQLESAKEWEFLIPGSPLWDEIHQRIYRAGGRVKEVNFDELPTGLPPLPDIPQGPFPQWKEYFLPEQTIRASQFPSVARFLKEQNDKMAVVFIVLYEDTYETAMGDGEFHYFRELSLDRVDAERYMEDNRGQFTRFYLRTMGIRLEREEFVFPNFSPDRYDRYTVEEVLESLESRLKDGWARGGIFLPLR